MTKRSLPRVGGAQEKLGLPTIMDRALAARHGVPYVHLAAFAIDVDRVREAHEGYDHPLPFAWEVFLTEAYLLDRFGAYHQAMIEDVVLSVLEGEPDVLGGQIVFAIWDAIERGKLPVDLRRSFAAWKARPKELVRALARLWDEEARFRRELAESSLGPSLDPPLAPPTKEALEAMARS